MTESIMHFCSDLRYASSYSVPARVLDRWHAARRAVIRTAYYFGNRTTGRSRVAEYLWNVLDHTDYGLRELNVYHAEKMFDHAVAVIRAEEADWDEVEHLICECIGTPYFHPALYSQLHDVVVESRYGYDYHRDLC